MQRCSDCTPQCKPAHSAYTPSLTFAHSPFNVRFATAPTVWPSPEGDYYIPKGTRCLYSVFIMHRRKDIWGEDADDFKPERWEGLKNGWEYLPFNGGPRICLGQQASLSSLLNVAKR